ncbi:MAG: MgtC/SapB family protein, partial [Minisyncoccia bacterium]
MIELSTLKIFGDLLIAAALGALIGLEREWARKDPGIRTFTFVSLGSALFVILGKLIVFNSSFENLDPTRILGQVIVGIGFLGAGIIIFQKEEGRLRGITTASMFWVAAGIGSAVGLGYYQIAIFVTLLVGMMNLILRPLEYKIDRRIDE